MLALVILGLALSLYADSELKQGMLDERKSTEEIASTRNVLSSSFWNAAVVLCIILGIVFLLLLMQYRPIGGL